MEVHGREALHSRTLSVGRRARNQARRFVVVVVVVAGPHGKLDRGGVGRWLRAAADNGRARDSFRFAGRARQGGLIDHWSSPSLLCGSETSISTWSHRGSPSLAFA